MATFNTTAYSAASSAYNALAPVYIDGSAPAAVSMSSTSATGLATYAGAFGNVMCAFAVDGGDSILGGNVIVVGALNTAGGLTAITVASAVARSTYPLYYPIPNTFIFAPSASGVTGTSTTGYSVYTFTSTSGSYTIPYTFAVAKTMYILAVGGGGSGGKNNGGGGGGGGVVMAVKMVPTGSDTITITIGACGTLAAITGTGGTTTVSFAANSGLNVIAGGGGNGGTYSSAGNAGSTSGGSGSGSSDGGSTSGAGNTSNGNLANSGGTGALSGGGGGAGTAGSSSTTLVNGHYCNGGNGVQCTLTGIKDFGSYGTYYWGGGGGGMGYRQMAGNGGLGGGGGGNADTAGNNGLGDTNGLNSGSNGNVSTNSTGSYGAAGGNTGSGGGGSVNSQIGGLGAAGIVIIAF